MTFVQETVAGTTGAETMSRAVRCCLAETGLRPSAAPRTAAVIAGIGTTAPHALRGKLLTDALDRAGAATVQAVPFPEPDALLADPDWELALVLSPWKRTVTARMDALSGSARVTGVVDTIVRHEGRTLGVNTNSWAAQAAMETLMGSVAPDGVLILGAGGSAHSVALAVRRAWPRAALAGSARSATALVEWTTRFNARAMAPDQLTGSPSLIVNTTTWGETDLSERNEFAFPFAELTEPGNRFFDLNNRTSALQTAALQGGMSVMSGTFMQRVTNACRAALLMARAS